jgi:hypothetical protein
MGAHYIIDGRHVCSVKAAFAEAKRRGYTGCIATLRDRLHAGADTWAEVCASPSPVLSASSKKSKARARDEMAEMLADYDKRKKEQGFE